MAGAEAEAETEMEEVAVVALVVVVPAGRNAGRSEWGLLLASARPISFPTSLLLPAPAAAPHPVAVLPAFSRSRTTYGDLN